ncbi:hypothetical protein ACJX0J_019604, partial [Zea mays]
IMTLKHKKRFGTIISTEIVYKCFLNNFYLHTLQWQHEALVGDWSTQYSLALDINLGLAVMAAVMFIFLGALLPKLFSLTRHTIDTILAISIIGMGPVHSDLKMKKS